MYPEFINEPVRSICTDKGHIFFRVMPGMSSEIIDLAVYSERRKGHGSRLISEMIEILIPLNVVSVYVYTRQSNEDAIKFYKMTGFREVCTVTNMYNGEGIDRNSVLFIKELNG